MNSLVLRPAPAALTVAVIGAAAILGAYFFQFVIGLAPCPLCLEQRIPYYVGIPLAVVVALVAMRQAPMSLVRVGLLLLAAIMLAGAGLGVYHAGIEWRLWPGPTECTGTMPALGAGVDLLRKIETSIVVRCDEAAWRFLGISLAGYNALISLALALIAALAGLRTAAR